MVNRDHLFMMKMTDDEYDHLRGTAYREGHNSVARYIRDRLGMQLDGNRGGSRSGAGRPVKP